MGRSAIVIGVSLLLVAPFISGAGAQSTSRVDSAMARASRLVAAGQGSGGRLVIDSVLAAAPTGSADYATALYWRARLSPDEAVAELDYLRLVIEHPTSRHVPEALLGLAEAARLRGDRERTARYLQQFVLENPDHLQRYSAGLSLARTLFERNRVPEACAALMRSHATAPESATELRNQMEYLLPRCRGVDTTARTPDGPAAVAGGVVAPPSAGRGAAGPPTAPPPAKTVPPATTATPPARGGAAATGAPQFTVQTGAFNSRAEADQAATRLRGQGFEARVVGTARPFRVHVGRFTTRAGADSLSRDLTQRRITNYVTTVPPGGE